MIGPVNKFLSNHLSGICFATSSGEHAPHQKRISTGMNGGQGGVK